MTERLAHHSRHHHGRQHHHDHHHPKTVSEGSPSCVATCPGIPHCPKNNDCGQLTRQHDCEQTGWKGATWNKWLSDPNSPMMMPKCLHNTGAVPTCGTVKHETACKWNPPS